MESQLQQQHTKRSPFDVCIMNSGRFICKSDSYVHSFALDHESLGSCLLNRIFFFVVLDATDFRVSSDRRQLDGVWSRVLTSQTLCSIRSCSIGPESIARRWWQFDLLADAEALGAIDAAAHEVASGVRPCGVEVVDEEHGAHGPEVVHLGLVLARLVVESCAAGRGCPHLARRGALRSDVRVGHLGEIRRARICKYKAFRQEFHIITPSD